MTVSGFLLINKPIGPSSHMVINVLRKKTGIKKIGHAGTLDPFASGLMICGVGREATKRLGDFIKLDKEYEAEIILGAESDTFDCKGVIKERKIKERPSLGDVKKSLDKFTGQYKQYPPRYSAKKIAGKKMYELARKNIDFVIEPKLINVYSLELLEYSWPRLKIKTKVSSGTYIRSLAFDLGAFLGVGAYVDKLVRLSIVGAPLKKSLELDDIDQANWPKKLKSQKQIERLLKGKKWPKWWNW